MHPRRNPDVKTTLLPDGYVVLYGADSDWAHTLNPTGAMVWEFCDGEHTVDQIAGEVAALLQTADKESFQTDIARLLDELIGLGLVSDAAL